MINELHRAKEFISRQRFTEAIHLLKSISNDKLLAFKQARELLVHLAIDIADVDLAIEALTELSSTFPNYQEYCDLLSDILSRKGRLFDVELVWLQFTKNNPNTANGFFNLAYHQKFIGKYSRAVSNYQTALLLGIEEPEEVYLNIASLQSNYLGDISSATASLKLCLDINQNYYNAKFNLASLYEQKGEIESAKMAFLNLYKSNPKELDALARFIDLSSENNSYIEVAEELISNTEINEVSSVVNLSFSLARFFEGQRKYEKAANYARCSNLTDERLRPKYIKSKQANYFEAIRGCFSAQAIQENSTTSEYAPVFICGLFRSGSTLLEQLLATHPKTKAAGELDYFTRVEATFREKLENNKFSFDDIDLNILESEYRKLLCQISPSEGVVIDKRPDNFIQIGLIKAIFPNAKFIETTRNPLDNILSIFFQRLGHSYTYSCSLMDIANYYLEYKKLMSYWYDIFADSIIQVNYEELVKKPKSSVDKVFKFLKLNNMEENDLLDFYKSKNFVTTASSTQVRKPLYQSSAGKYQNYLRYLPELNEIENILNLN